MKRFSLLLAAATMLLLSSCSLLLPMGGQRYPYGGQRNPYGNNGNRYGVIRQGTHINDVLRINGQPDYADSYMKGRNRIDVLYYLPSNWNQGYNYDRKAIRYTFRNSYLQSVKQVKMKDRRYSDRYDRRYNDRYDRRDDRYNRQDDQGNRNRRDNRKYRRNH